MSDIEDRLARLGIGPGTDDPALLRLGCRPLPTDEPATSDRRCTLCGRPCVSATHRLSGFPEDEEFHLDCLAPPPFHGPRSRVVAHQQRSDEWRALYKEVTADDGP